MTYARDPYDTDEPPCFCPLENTGPVTTTAEFCPAHGDPDKPAPEPPGEIADDDLDYEPCEHECDEDCTDEGDLGCQHTHCFNCGGCTCPGYCDDEQTYNLRFAETGGADPPAPSPDREDSR